MFCRAMKGFKDNSNPTNPDQTFMGEEKSYFFMIAATAVLVAGFLCLFLDRNWTSTFPSLFKIPIYALVAQSLTYMITFGIVDFVNLILSCFQNKNALNIVETKDQIITLLLCCFSAGMFYGLIFGLMDLEDDNYSSIKNDFFYETRLCVPIGMLSGFVAGFLNEVLRNNVIF